MHFVYILYSTASNLYYVGESSNVEIRLTYHNGLNPNSFTSKHRPWILKRKIAVNSKSIALKMERYIKKRKSRSFIERLIVDDQVVNKLIGYHSGRLETSSNKLYIENSDADANNALIYGQFDTDQITFNGK